ncbi:MAG: hypothetical protein P1U57_10705, partial [Oleibacter sp.]|nr:hypothetical protein [Thalassolituus sp.]
TLIGRALPRQDLIGHVPDHRVRETGPGKRVKNMRKPKLESNKPTEPKASKNNKTSTKKDDKRPEKSLDASHGKPRGGAMLTNRGKGKDKKTATQRKID